MLLEKYEPNELIKLGNQISQGAKGLAISSLDAIIIVNLSSALQKDGKERERLLDRMLGKAIQRIGGENEGEAIKIASASAQLDIENLDDDRLHSLIEALEGVALSRAQPAEVVAALIGDDSAANDEGD